MPSSILHPSIYALLAALGTIQTVQSSILEDGFGYRAITDVSAALNLALDIKAMRQAKDDLKEKRNIYENGKSSTRSLRDLSWESVNVYAQTPYYNLYRAGYELLGAEEEGDDPLEFDGTTVDRYADTVVQDLFLLDVTHIEAEAALAMNVGMAYLGSLGNALNACKTNDQAIANQGLDEAAAFWVGQEQVKGDGSTGFFFYNLAQFVGAKFNQNQGDSEVFVNQNVLASLTTMQSNIAQNSCASIEGYKTMRGEVKKLVGHFNRVLVQMLLHRVETITAGEDSDFVELYSLAILPQISSCNPDAYYKLVELTIESNVTPGTQQDVIAILQSVYSCLHLTCKDVGAYEGSLIPECQDTPPTQKAIVGYQPTADVQKFLGMDRDIRQIRWMMKFEAFVAAQDFYEHGWNGVIPFGNIAKNSFLAELDMTTDFTAISDYYGETQGDTFHGMILDVFEGRSPFDTPSAAMRASMVDGFLKGPLIYLAITGALEEALLDCQDQNNEALRRHWDEAVAFFVGSTEGSEDGGAESVPGESLFGLGDRYCEYFGDCSPMEAEVNEVLLETFRGVASALSSGGGQCEQISNEYNQNIRPNLLVAMIQGTLYNYIQWSQGDEDNTGYAYAFSRILAPVFSKSFPDKNGLENFALLLDFETYSFPPEPAKIGELFGYLTTILETFPLDCVSVGAIRESETGPIRQVCPADTPIDAPPIPAPPTPNTRAPTMAPSREFEYFTPTRAPAGVPKQVPNDNRPLGWDRYSFVDRNAAENASRFSLDVKNMWTATTLESARVAFEIGGSVNSGLYGGTSITTIKGLNEDSINFMRDDIMHNFYMYALYSDSDFETGSTFQVITDADPWPYGNTVVDLALQDNHGNSVKLAAEAAIVMNIWMMIVHQLYEASRACNGGTDAAAYIDSAFGLWLGQEQGEKKFDTGWSMYSIAQEAYKLYGFPEDEAPVNEKLMEAFQVAQETARTCTAGGAETFRVLRTQIDDIIHELSKPLLQMLLYYLSVQDTNFVELFSLAFIPQIITCNIDRFGDLSENLFQAQILDDTDKSKLHFLDYLAGGLTCLRFTCEDFITGSAASESLTIIVNDVCDDMTNDFGIDYLAAYQVGGDDDHNRKINEIARLDLDLLQIGILMKAKAYKNAEEIFEYGRNSRVTDSVLFSLKQLSEDPVRQAAGAVYGAYAGLYEDDFGVSLITRVFQGTQYPSASRLEKAEAVVRSIQTSVSFVNIVGRLFEAVRICSSGESGVDPPTLVDEAAALFVGSIEGSKSGGSETSSGTMLMALGKEMCDAFGTCATQGDSTSNEFIMFAFSDLKEWFESGDCDSAEEILQESLLTMLPVSMIQATIAFAYESKSIGRDGPKVAADVVGQSIIPLVNAVNVTSAATLIANLDYEDSTSSGAVDTDKVVDAIAFALRGMGVDCNAIGTFNSGESLCRAPEEDVPPVQDTPTDLGDGKFTTTTYVQDRADIAKDVQQMRDQIEINPTLAVDIYTSGENSPIYNAAGDRTGTRSLKEFSTSAKDTMTFNPLYQATVFALRGVDGNYLSAPAWQYADTLVQESFGKGGQLAADAAVALNLWMETANELFQMLSNCRKQKLKDNDGIHSIDEAAAYWLGDAKTDSGVENGHLLYALTEEMAAQFATVRGTGQSFANTNLLQLFQAAKLELSYPAACSDDATTVRRIRHLVNQAVSQMMVPMVQALIHNIIKENKDKVRVYAHAVVPQVVGCSPSAFNFLNEKLIVGSYSAEEIDSIVLSLQSVYGCLGITCTDVGYHQDSDLDIDCDDDDIEALSGYRTRTDVAEFAQLDLDIQELDVLMAMEAYEAADELYRFGRHAQTGLDGGRVSLSLQSLATSTGRSSVPEFKEFEQFYGSDSDYADTIMRRTFESSSSMTAIQRRYVAVGTAQYMILFMGALEAMEEAIDACERDSRDIGASQYWDRAAAYIIGHLEGTKANGSKEGRLIWGLAKRVCQEWGTCSTSVEGNALVNERILSLLYTGRGALTSGRKDSCPGLKNAVSELRLVLRTPLVQGAISAVVKTFETSGVQREQEHAKAHALANALLPLIDNVNRQAANTIQSNLDFADAPLSGGVTSVVNSFTGTMKDMGVACGDVGASETVDSCSGQVSDDSSNALMIIVLIGVVCATLALGFFAYKKRRNNKTKDEPVFVPNEKGELSHSEVIGNGSSSRVDAQEIMHNDADAAADDDFEHTELPETV